MATFSSGGDECPFDDLTAPESPPPSPPPELSPRPAPPAQPAAAPRASEAPPPTVSQEAAYATVNASGGACPSAAPGGSPGGDWGGGSEFGWDDDGEEDPFADISNDKSLQKPPSARELVPDEPLRVTNTSDLTSPAQEPQGSGGGGDALHAVGAVEAPPPAPASAVKGTGLDVAQPRERTGPHVGAGAGSTASVGGDGGGGDDDGDDDEEEFALEDEKISPEASAAASSAMAPRSIQTQQRETRGQQQQEILTGTAARRASHRSDDAGSFSLGDSRDTFHPLESNVASLEASQKAPSSSALPSPPGVVSQPAPPLTVGVAALPASSSSSSGANSSATRQRQHHLPPPVPIKKSATNPFEAFGGGGDDDDPFGGGAPDAPSDAFAAPPASSFGGGSGRSCPGMSNVGSAADASFLSSSPPQASALSDVAAPSAPSHQHRSTTQPPQARQPSAVRSVDPFAGNGASPFDEFASPEATDPVFPLDQQPKPVPVVPAQRHDQPPQSQPGYPSQAPQQQQHGHASQGLPPPPPTFPPQAHSQPQGYPPQPPQSQGSAVLQRSATLPQPATAMQFYNIASGLQQVQQQQQHAHGRHSSATQSFVPSQVPVPLPPRCGSAGPTPVTAHRTQSVGNPPLAAPLPPPHEYLQQQHAFVPHAGQAPSQRVVSESPTVHPPFPHSRSSSANPQTQQQQPVHSGGVGHATSWSVGDAQATASKGFRPVRRVPAARCGYGGRVLAVLPGHRAAQGSECRILVGSLRHALTCTEPEQRFVATGTGQRWVEAVGALPAQPLSAALKVDTVQAILGKMAVPGPRSPLLSLLSLLLAGKFDWAADRHKLLDILAEQRAAREHMAPRPSPVRPEFFSTASSSSSSSASQSAAEQQAAALQSVESLLFTGRHEEAVEVALAHKLYAFAFLIAQVCPTPAQHHRTVTALVNDTLAPTSPLAAILLDYNRLPIVELPTDVEDWAAHLQMALANYQEGTDAAILAWGDRLAAAGHSHPAHFCYLVLTMTKYGSQLAEQLSSRAKLVGGSHRRDRSRCLFLTPQNVLLTEIVEHIRQRDRPKYVKPSLISFRVMLAAMYVEIGMIDRAVAYLDHAARCLPQTQGSEKRKDDEFPRSVLLVVEQLRRQIDAAKAKEKVGGGGTGAGGGGGGGGWWPFGGRSATPKATKSDAATASSAASSQLPPLPRAQSVRQPSPVAAASTAAPARASSTSGTTTPAKQQQEKPVDGGGGASDSSSSTGGGWTSWFRSSAKKQKKDEPKPKAIDAVVDAAEAVPEYDPVTGRFLFAKTEEEKQIEEQIKAGPPKLSTPIGGGGGPSFAASPLASSGGAPGGGGPQFFSTGPSGAPGLPGTPGLPPRGPSAPRAGSAQPKYVDMFNT